MDLSAFLEGVLDLPAFLDVNANSVSVLACDRSELSCRRRRRSLSWPFQTINWIGLFSGQIS